MSTLDGLIAAERVMVGLKAQCKREALAQIAEKAATEFGGDASQILDVLLEREKLGSTGIGNGVAIPHGKIPGIESMVGYVARLEQPVDFDALDNEPVDLIFALLAPDESDALHLKCLSKIARLLRDEETRQAMRGAKDTEALLAIILEETRSQAA